MAQDWLADVRKYVADADEAVVDKIVKYLGIALQNRDSSLVSFSDKTETDRVRENYLKKKLGLTHDDATLDAAIASVGERMKADRTKNRVTVYYLLAEHYGLLNLFGGVAGAAAAGAAAAAATTRETVTEVVEEAKPVAAAPLAAAAGVTAAATAVPERAAAAVPETAYTSYDDDGGDRGGLGWLPWLLLAALLAAAIFFGLKYCSNKEAAPAAGVENSTTNMGDMNMSGANTTAPVIPTGAGVTKDVREGRPMLTVYFDTGKSAVTNDLAAAATDVKAFVEANPGTVLSVSGFNDPTGNAKLNAELSKNRAKAVKAALEKLGIPADKVALVKPAETTGTGGNNAESRRVDVTVIDASALPVEDGKPAANAAAGNATAPANATN